MMSLDSITLYLVATMVAALLGAMMVFFGRQENSPALKWWGTAYLLGAASVALWTAAGDKLGPHLYLALNAVGFVACGMVWNAARVFHGRKPNWPGLLVGALAWTAAATLLDPAASMLRMIVGAGIVSVYAALTASELWVERRKSLQRRWPAFVVPVMHGCVLMLPILLGSFLRPNDAGFSNSIWVTVFAVELVLYAVGTVFVIFMLVSERTVTAHRTAASTDPLTGMLNRRGFSEACGRVIEREAKAGRPVTVMIFDIDHFKSINDRFGHPAGDEMLKLFSTVVVSNRASATCRVASAARSSPPSCRVRSRRACWSLSACARPSRPPASSSTRARSTPPSASASPAVRPAPSSKCCWPRPTPRSTRPSAAAETASSRRRSCHCRWRTGAARAPRGSACPTRSPKRSRRPPRQRRPRGNPLFTIRSLPLRSWNRSVDRTRRPP